MLNRRKNRPPRVGPRLPRLALRLLLQIAGFAALTMGLYWCASQVEILAIERMSATGRVLDLELTQILTSLQHYITVNGLTLDQADRLQTWDQGNTLIELQLVADGTVIYDSTQYGWSGGARSSIPFTRVEDPQLGVVRFSDGDAAVSVNPAFYHNLERRITKILMGVCFGLFVLFMGLRFTRLVRDILRIDQGVQMLESGDLTCRIRVSSPDEMQELAASLNRMAEELQWRNETEDRLHRQNYDRITAISHDLRTPLTAIIGYTELLQAGGQSADEQQDYLRRILSRSRFMLQMTNCLFDTARTHTGTIRNPQRIDGRSFLDEALDGMTQNLAVSGLDLAVVQRPREPFFLHIDPIELQRVFSNLEGNILRYADPAQPVRIRADLTEGMLHLVQSNGLRHDMPEGGTGVGLRTAEGIVRSCGGSLSVQRLESTFAVDLRLPLQTDRGPEEEL